MFRQNLNIDNELVSIIIPTYRRVEKLKRALLSILSQTVSCYEIIIINDDKKCIYDDIEQVLKGKKHIYIHNDMNMGLSYNRNLGIELSRGNYLIFLDDDDYLKEDYLEHALKIFKKNNVDVVYFNALVLGESLQPESIFNHVFSKEKIQCYNFICPVSIILKKPKLETTKFDESRKMSEDWDFWLQLLYKEKFIFYYEDKDLCYYDRSGFESMTCHDDQLRVARSYYSNYLEIIKKYESDRDKESNYLISLIEDYYNERIKRLELGEIVCRFSYEKLIEILSTSASGFRFTIDHYNYMFGTK